MNLHVLHVVGARPNFMKAAPVMRALSRAGTAQTLVHTGQHYDALMNDVFFAELELPAPDVNLGVGSASHAAQTAEIMRRFEPALLETAAEAVVVYGDVNSTMAAALVCAKLGVPVVHVEAGLRSFDRTMPEEINRLVTDQLADLLFTTSPEARDNLVREGVAPERIRFVGNVMIDTLVRLGPRAEARWPSLAATLETAGAAAVARGGRFGLVTLHRPSNVDAPADLERLMEALADIAGALPLLFPVHPRTRARLPSPDAPALHLLPPLGYLDFLALERRAALVITDSGGVQEESTYLGVPCITVRENTERPVTVTLGTNVLVGRDPGRLRAEAARVLAGRRPPRGVPQLWDGHAGERIASELLAWAAQRRASSLEANRMEAA